MLTKIGQYSILGKTPFKSHKTSFKAFKPSSFKYVKGKTSSKVLSQKVGTWSSISENCLPFKTSALLLSKSSGVKLTLNIFNNTCL